jgi:hypothetical protein
MVEFAQHLVLLYESCHIGNFALVDGFYRHFLLGQSIFSLINNSKATLTHFFFEKVLVFDITVACLDEKPFLDNDILIEPFVNNILL